MEVEARVRTCDPFLRNAVDKEGTFEGIRRGQKRLRMGHPGVSPGRCGPYPSYYLGLSLARGPVLHVFPSLSHTFLS